MEPSKKRQGALVPIPELSCKGKERSRRQRLFCTPYLQADKIKHDNLDATRRSRPSPRTPYALHPKASTANSPAFAFLIPVTRVVSHCFYSKRTATQSKQPSAMDSKTPSEPPPDYETAAAQHATPIPRGIPVRKGPHPFDLPIIAYLKSKRVILASASPRRRALLAQVRRNSLNWPLPAIDATIPLWCSILTNY
jgi:hypothetical protein